MSADANDSKEGSGGNSAGKCVLIVEDNELNMKLLDRKSVV